MKKVLEKLNQLTVGATASDIQEKLQEFDMESFFENIKDLSEKEELVFSILNQVFENIKRFYLVHIGKPEDFGPTKGLEAEDMLVEGIAEKANLSVNVIVNEGHPYISLQSDEGLSWIIEVLPAIEVIVFDYKCDCDVCNP